MEGNPPDNIGKLVDDDSLLNRANLLARHIGYGLVYKLIQVGRKYNPPADFPSEPFLCDVGRDFMGLLEYLGIPNPRMLELLARAREDSHAH